MLKLYGFAVSNYYNVVKAAMLEKELSFEEVLVFPGADPAHSARSPMGKVPALETEGGALSETQVMLDYLEEVYPEQRLYPVDAFARAKVREIMRVIELYLELPARRLYPEAFFGGKVSEQTKAEVEPALRKGLVALKQLAGFESFIGGDAFTFADIAAAIHLPLVSDAYKRIYGQDPVVEAIPELKSYLQRVRERPSMQRVMADYKLGLAAYFEQKRQSVEQRPADTSA